MDVFTLYLRIAEEKPCLLLSAVIGLVLLNPRCNGYAVDVCLELCLSTQVR